jgi:imidazolonepropionase-like amidohydrolase
VTEGGQERSASSDAAREWVVRASRGLVPGAGFVADCEVLVRGGVIAWVGHRDVAGARPDLSGVETMTFDEATLVPGLIDSHTHLTFSGGTSVDRWMAGQSDLALLAHAAGRAQHALAHGVTTLVDCGSRALTVHELRDAVTSSRLIGPRLLAAGAPITTTAGHCHWLGGCADSHDDVIRVLRARVADGADLVKLMLTGGNMTKGSNPMALQYDSRVVADLAADARRLGKPLVVHAHCEAAVAVAARGGARVVAHATCVDDHGNPPSGATFDALLDAGAFVDPTLTVGSDVSESQLGSAAERSEWASRRRVREAMLPVYRAMHERGIPLLAGTDGGSTGVPHHCVGGSVRALHREVGLSVEQALLAATDLPARAFELRDRVGALEAGLCADLAVFAGDLENDLDALDRPIAVWTQGRRAPAAAAPDIEGARCCTTSST